MKRKNSFNRNELLECSEGKLFDTNHARVPTDPLLMVDRITNITINGGKYNKGIIIAELDINEKKWFFHHIL